MILRWLSVYSAWNLDVLGRLKTAQIVGEERNGEKPLCWYIHPDNPTSIEIVYTGDYQFNNFIDPALVLFGIVSNPADECLQFRDKKPLNIRAENPLKN